MLATAKPYTESPTILLIDDEDAIRHVLSLALEFEGYQVFTASNGEEGLRTLRRIPRPGLILLDLMMPVMDGWEFMEVLHKDPGFSDIPVVVITAFKNSNEIKHAAAVIEKPVELNELFQVAGRFCQRRKGGHG
ncbi:MAG: response regulator [Bdellovibrionia bacterium]